MLFSPKQLGESDEAVNDAEIRRMEIAMATCLKQEHIDEYNRPHRQLMTYLIANYRRRIFKAHDLKNIRPFSDTPGDPLVKVNNNGFAATKQVPDDVFRFNPEENKYTKIEESLEDDSNYKKMNRRHLLYCNGEAAACNYIMGGTADKPIWSNKTTETLRTLVVRCGLDPPAARRMKLETLEHHEKELRQKVLTGLRDGKWSTWDEGLANAVIQQYINIEFRLRDPEPRPATTYKPTRQPGKGGGDQRYYQPYSPAKESKTSKGKGKGSDAAADAGNQSQDPNIKGNYLMKDSETGKGFCIPWANKKPCKCDGKWESPQCPYVHKCNWVGCANRKKCSGASWHRENPGKGVIHPKNR